MREVPNALTIQNWLRVGRGGNGYRYGFNGMERDDELNGVGNSYDFGARIYDARIGKFLSRDPLAGTYSWQSPYAFAANNPVLLIDYLGMGPGDPIKGEEVKDGDQPLQYALDNDVEGGTSLEVLDNLASLNPETFKNYNSDASDSEKWAYWKNSENNWMIHKGDVLNIGGEVSQEMPPPTITQEGIVFKREPSVGQYVDEIIGLTGEELRGVFESIEDAVGYINQSKALKGLEEQGFTVSISLSGPLVKKFQNLSVSVTVGGAISVYQSAGISQKGPGGTSLASVGTVAGYQYLNDEITPILYTDVRALGWNVRRDHMTATTDLDIKLSIGFKAVSITLTYDMSTFEAPPSTEGGGGGAEGYGMTRMQRRVGTRNVYQTRVKTTREAATSVFKR